jgi:prevent-host-death family protein
MLRFPMPEEQVIDGVVLHIGLTQAKKCLDELVQDVENGKLSQVIITRRGKPVARIVGSNFNLNPRPAQSA